MKNNILTHLTSTTMPEVLNSINFSQIISSLSQVILLILIFFWCLKKIDLLKNKTNNSSMKIIDRIFINSNQSIIILDIKEVKLVLGVTSKKISYLYTLSSYLKNEEADKKKKYT